MTGRVGALAPPLAVAAALAVAGCGGAPDGGPDATPGDATNVDAAPAAPDYVLFAPLSSTTTYLIDRAGEVVHTWASTARPGAAVYLLDDGGLLRAEELPSTVFRAGGIGGRIATYAWDGTPSWHYDYASATHHAHHDAIRLPDGHVLAIAWEVIADADALAAGRDPALLPATGSLWADHLVEIDPATDTIVWQWHAWDHLIQDRDPTAAGYGVVADHPELVDVNAGGRAQNDWTHVNAVAYRADLDQIVLSVHNLGEVWILDHGTTTAEAASHQGGRRGHGGDLLYRWGNPAVTGAGTAADQQLFAQHAAHWIDDGLPGAGHLLVFNNGSFATRPYSTVDELDLPVDADGGYDLAAGPIAPAAPSWRYVADPPEAMFAANISGAQRLPDGDTLICVGPDGRFLEVTDAGDTVWTYQYPGAMTSVFRATAYPATHPGLAGRDLAPTGPIAP
ncbi:MAG: aryl-sulfate sulfotransferase [Kofleriaceae bacterium]|nr:aryl-sulfate sulfotransferase [Kofleriaceae bacterium]MCB9571151.1 aryl-sulfate sulfotransferase [Kofleriaceae bacterium]